MSPPRLRPLVLVRRQDPSVSAVERWAVAGLWVVITGGIFAMFFLVFFDFDRDSLAKALERFWEKMRDAPEEFLQLLIVPVALVAHFWAKHRAAKYERVFLEQTGIRYQSPIFEALRFLSPSWSLQWSQLRELRIGLPGAAAHPNLVFLEFDAGPVKRKLPALYWVPVDPAAQAEFPGTPPTPRRFFSLGLSAFDREGALREVEQSVIVRYAKQAGVKIATGTMRRPTSVLESNRHATAAAALDIVLLTYGLIDFGMNHETYAVFPPLVLFALGGAIAMLAGALWLASAGVPRVETLGLALFLGVTTGFALYPGVLRLNEATDSEGLRTYDYRLKAYSVFVPVDPKLPELDFSKDGDYWAQFKLGTIHRFELRKGGLGFYQVNMAPVRDRMREYFRGKR